MDPGVPKAAAFAALWVDRGKAMKVFLTVLLL
jgi:hypothetical protein